MATSPAPQAGPAEAQKPAGAHYEIIAFVRDGDTDTALQDLMAQQQAGPLHVARGTVRDAIKFLEKQQRAPRLLIVDVSGDELPLSEVDALAEACEPTVSVVVLGERQDVGLFRELIRLGVADYLVKPILPDLIAPHISGADPKLRSQPHRTGKVVAVAGARGGIGTTTVATAVAWTLANRENRRCALVDLNPYGGTLSVQLNTESGGLVEALENADHLDALFLERTLVQQGPRLFTLTAELPFDQDAAMDDKAVEALIQTLERQFHYVVLDVPRMPGSLYAYVLRRAGVRVLISDRTVPAMRDLTRMLGLIDNTSGRSILVLNDQRPNSEGLADRKMIEETLSRPFDLYLPFDKSLPRVVDNLGEPLAEAGGPFADAVKDLTGTLSGQRRNRAKSWLRLLRPR